MSIYLPQAEKKFSYNKQKAKGIVFEWNGLELTLGFLKDNKNCLSDVSSLTEKYNKFESFSDEQKLGMHTSFAATLIKHKLLTKWNAKDKDGLAIPLVGKELAALLFRYEELFTFITESITDIKNFQDVDLKN